MCRYAWHIYKEHYACFYCRKMFRPTARLDLPEHGRPGYRDFRLVKCPECGQPMHDMGLNFKAPKRHDVQQWKKVQTLHEHGLTWHDCGCGGRGPHVARVSEVKSYLEERERERQERQSARVRAVTGEWRNRRQGRHPTRGNRRYVC